MAACAVFFDAGYIEKVLLREHPGKRIDYAKLAAKMAGDEALLRSYYYNCLPYQSDPPTQEEKAAYDRKVKFVDALRYLPRFEVRLGKLAKVGVGQNGRPIFQQKRVDLMLGVDMALLAAKGKVTSIAIFTGDSDVIPAVEVVKQEGVVVHLWHGSMAAGAANPPSRDLHQMCDERFDVATVIDDILMERKQAEPEAAAAEKMLAE
ncbi:NYN domain-containing protein [Phenylobacterium sp. NIBR 498073]|jgi:uncharacterized LabA/DUF88 family protein|uniref:NYN domain-containing protein n=1 Tax=Phenylobacterium sp. NIBR 498073 TaxID=3015177 RepID=UPI0022B51DC4|nr:NYN domain-containing protein [Phenylobacterium sp. NIBR 498073]WGU40341.1 NYN domain-containing protein [Phenylobacterium sp. NIBR 498073]